MTKKKLAVVAVIIAVVIIISGFLVVTPRDAGNSAPTVPFTLSVAVEGAPVVGGNFTILTTVTAKTWVNATEVTQGPTFLSLDVTHAVQVNTPDPGDDPWGLPSVWNLTGKNASLGITFALNVTGVYAGESTLNAQAWWPPSSMHNWSDVQLTPTGGLVDLMSVQTMGFAQYKLIIQENSPRVRSEDASGTESLYQPFPIDSLETPISSASSENNYSSPEVNPQAKAPVQNRNSIPSLGARSQTLVTRPETLGPSDPLAMEDLEPSPSRSGTVTVQGRFIYDNLITKDQAGANYLPQSEHPYLPNCGISYQCVQTKTDPGAAFLGVVSPVPGQSRFD
jgi:hypothetical protein